MAHLNIDVSGQKTWPDLLVKRAQGKLIEAMGNDVVISLATLDDGTVGGRPSVTIRIDLPNGTTVVTQTTVRLLQSAAAAILGRYGVVD